MRTDFEKLRLIDFVYHSTPGFRVLKKKKTKSKVWGFEGIGCRAPDGAVPALLKPETRNPISGFGFQASPARPDRIVPGREGLQEYFAHEKFTPRKTLQKVYARALRWS